MSIISLSPADGEEPTAADLAAIEAEWPLIQAELDQLDAEIAELVTSPYMSELGRRRIRRAERRVLESGRDLAVRGPESEDAA